MRLLIPWCRDGSGVSHLSNRNSSSLRSTTTQPLQITALNGLYFHKLLGGYSRLELPMPPVDGCRRSVPGDAGFDLVAILTAHLMTDKSVLSCSETQGEVCKGNVPHRWPYSFASGFEIDGKQAASDSSVPHYRPLFFRPTPKSTSYYGSSSRANRPRFVTCDWRLGDLLTKAYCRSIGYDGLLRYKSRNPRETDPANCTLEITKVEYNELGWYGHCPYLTQLRSTRSFSEP